MSVKETIKRQYQGIVDGAALRFSGVRTPPEGWVATVRKSLGMSGAQLARRLGVTRAAVSQTERNEAEGGVTIRHMQTVAGALNCRFVYAIVPEEGGIKDVILAQAGRRAAGIVRNAGGQMALEEQSLSDEKNKEEIARLRDDLAHYMPSDLWEEK
ncbi:MAG: mobile mystery protein A [Candidatus Dadabacteria bacterium]|nr:mobile mystery protein A [Candidatus Dadabacteria bacterium]